MWITYIQNTKSPRLDGLNVATLPKSRAVQVVMLDGPIRNAVCQLDSRIENHQKLVNSKLDKENSERLDTCWFCSFKKWRWVKKIEEERQKIITINSIKSISLHLKNN